MKTSLIQELKAIILPNRIKIGICVVLAFYTLLVALLGLCPYNFSNPHSDIGVDNCDSFISSEHRFLFTDIYNDYFSFGALFYGLFHKLPYFDMMHPYYRLIWAFPIAEFLAVYLIQTILQIIYWGVDKLSSKLRKTWLFCFFLIFFAPFGHSVIDSNIANNIMEKNFSVIPTYDAPIEFQVYGIGGDPTFDAQSELYIERKEGGEVV